MNCKMWRDPFVVSGLTFCPLIRVQIFGTTNKTKNIAPYTLTQPYNITAEMFREASAVSKSNKRTIKIFIKAATVD